jgi:antitoxin component of MazEF toxin-antitoxin module
MHIGLRQWGNSKAIRLPHKLIKTLNLAPNQLLEVTATSGGLLLRPAATSRQLRIQLLQERMATLSEENRTLLFNKMAALGSR